MITATTPKITNNPVRNNFHSYVVKLPFLYKETIPVATAKKITNKTLSISVWYLINSLYLSFMIAGNIQTYSRQFKSLCANNPLWQGFLWSNGCPIPPPHHPTATRAKYLLTLQRAVSLLFSADVESLLFWFRLLHRD